MRSYLQEWNDLDALFKSTSQQFVWKFDLNLPNICFSLPPRAESESTLEGSTTTEVAVLPADET